MWFLYAKALYKSKKFLSKKIFQKPYKFNYFCRKLNIKNIVIPLVDNSSLNNIKEENKTVDFF